MNACDDALNATAVIVGSLSLFGASVFSLWRHQEKANPVAREIRFAQDTAPMPYIDNGVQVLAIAKGRKGDPTDASTWYTFPKEIRRAQIEHLYDTCIRMGKSPSPERNLLKSGVMSRAQLQAFKDDAYKKRWIEYARSGSHSPWSFTRQGEKDLIFCYMRLNGKLPYEGHEHQRRISR